MREHGFINLNLLWRTPFPDFGRTYSFSKNPTQSFINETPGVMQKKETYKTARSISAGDLPSAIETHIVGGRGQQEVRAFGGAQR